MKELVAERQAHRGPYFQARAAKLFIDGVVEGVTGHLTEPGNASELAQGILDILRNPGKRKEMAKASRELAVSKYSLEMTADLYEEIYRRIMSL